MSGNAMVRRIITAQSRDGANVFAINEEVESYVSDGSRHEFGQQIWRIFGSDTIPQLPCDADVSYADTVFAPPGGYRIQVCEFPAAGTESNLIPRGVTPELGTAIHRSGRGAENTRPGSMHCTDSVDIMVILDGEIGLQLKGGAEVLLRAGDVLVQNGVAHIWKKTAVPCRVCMVAIGAERNESVGP